MYTETLTIETDRVGVLKLSWGMCKTLQREAFASYKMMKKRALAQNKFLNFVKKRACHGWMKCFVQLSFTYTVSGLETFAPAQSVTGSSFLAKIHIHFGIVWIRVPLFLCML